MCEGGKAPRSRRRAGSAAVAIAAATAVAGLAAVLAPGSGGAALLRPAGAAAAADAPADGAAFVLTREAFRDRLAGGWAGQMVGVSYGSIYEFVSNGKIIEGPLRPWRPEFIENSLGQDDLYVEGTFLAALEKHGPRITPRQAGAAFAASKYPLWHANDAARENLRRGIHPPESGHPRSNPHADDIDFQIEADLFGLIAPGMPRAAGRLCDTFGGIMNYGDGVYGGRFVAAMYAHAYREPEPTPAAVERCVLAGLAAIPADSDYAAVVRDVFDGYRKHPDDWRATWKEIEDRWAGTDTCPDGVGKPFNIDAKLNGAYIVIGLLYGGADWAKTLEISTRCGQDADCNPSNAAGVLGALYGLKRIPSEYTAGIAALKGRKFDHTDYDFDGMVDASEAVARRVVAAGGGKVGEDGSLRLPAERPEPPKRLEQVRAFSEEQRRAWAADFERKRREALVARIPVGEWAPGWRLIKTGTEMDPGLRPLFGEPSVLVTHPVSQSEPAALEARVTLPKGSPRLVLSVASWPEPSNSDWELRVLADGNEVAREVIHSPGKWRNVSVDLSRYAGRTVRLRLENAAGGGSPWSYEGGYWSRIRVEP